MSTTCSSCLLLCNNRTCFFFRKCTLLAKDIVLLISACFIKGDGIHSTSLVKHYLIESSAKGVCIKGSTEEPYFGKFSLGLSLGLERNNNRRKYPGCSDSVCTTEIPKKLGLWVV